MQRAILGHTEQAYRRQHLFALLPAGVAVFILAGQINAPNSSTPAETTRTEMAQTVSTETSPQSATLEHAPQVPVPAPALTLTNTEAAPEPEIEETRLREQNDEQEANIPTAQQAGSVHEGKAESIATAPLEPQGVTTEITVKKGDSLSALLTRAGVRAKDWLAVARLNGDARKLRMIQPGRKLQVTQDDGRLIEILYPISDINTLVVTRDENGFSSTVMSRATSTRVHVAEGNVSDNLYLAAIEAGLSDGLIMTFADIFAWDIDFARDVRKGDRLRVVYEEQYDSENGKTVGRPRILAAEYEQNKTTLNAYWYTPEQGRPGYYSTDGRPLRKAFLRAPVDFTRISSRYSSGRLHPILNKVRAHKGVDYAARRGTPIRATGDGTVVHAANKGGYGRTVIIRHNGALQTLYAHMSGYGSGIKRGSKVSQGQVIGYVGSSGLATGPHLHYEFHKNGQHTDPLSVKLPKADPLPKNELPRFRATVQPAMEQLAKLRGEEQVAQLDNAIIATSR